MNFKPRWWNGRHKGLKIPRKLFPCRFKSGPGHHGLAIWPSGKAEACKAFIPSSNLGIASKGICREMAERSKAAVLKTVEVKASRGSNPFLPATFTYLRRVQVFPRFFVISSFLASFAFSFININNATKTELMKLPGIGVTKATAIIDYRTKQPFTSVDELKNVKGISNRIFNNIKDDLTISGETDTSKIGAKTRHKEPRINATKDNATDNATSTPANTKPAN